MSPYRQFQDHIGSQRETTARFRPALFHVHSVDSHDWASQRAIADPIRNARARFSTDEGVGMFLDELASNCDVACITDHMQAGYACRLSAAAQKRPDLLVLPGMEVNLIIPPLRSVIHVLALFPPGTEAGVLERILLTLPPAAGRHGAERLRLESGLGDWMKRVRSEGGLVVLAHIEGDDGHRNVVRMALTNELKMYRLDGDGLDEAASREIAEAYASFLASTPPDAVEIMKAEHRQHYEPLRYGNGGTCRIACVMRSDSHCLEELPRIGCKTFLKLPSLTFQSVRNSLLFYETRIRFHSDLPTSPVPRLLGLSLTSAQAQGFFGDVTIGFSDNLNCIIGPRGSGKSTLIEALRYVLGGNLAGAFGERDAERLRIATGIQRANLSGTIVRLLYEDESRAVRVLQAAYDPNEPAVTEVFDTDGNRLPVSQAGLLGSFPARVFGWSEIELLGREPDLQRSVRDRLIPGIDDAIAARDQLRRQLAQSTADVLAKCKQLENKLAEDGGILGRYAQYVAEFERINTQEVQVLFEELDLSRSKLQRIAAATTAVRAVDEGFAAVSVSPLDALTGVPDPAACEPLVQWWRDEVASLPAIVGLKPGVVAGLRLAYEAIEAAQTALDSIAEQEKPVAEAREKSLRDRTQADAAEDFTRALREGAKQRLDGASMRRKEYEGLWHELQSLLAARKALMSTVVEQQQLIWERREAARTELNERLAGLAAYGLSVAVRVERGSSRTSYVSYLREILTGQAFGHYLEKKVAERCAGMVTPFQLATAIATTQLDGFTQNGQNFDTAETLAREDAQTFIATFSAYRKDDAACVTVVDRPNLEKLLHLEEQPWDDDVRILLDGVSVDQRSPGQRSSAMLPLVAMAEKVPLIIDQPEDNLDNRLVGKVLAELLADLKERRQIIVATHSANIVVGGDAEQVIVVEPLDGRKATVAHAGCIDAPEIVAAVIGIMEGGKQAFEARRRRYETLQ